MRQEYERIHCTSNVVSSLYSIGVRWISSSLAENGGSATLFHDDNDWFTLGHDSLQVDCGRLVSFAGWQRLI